MRNEAEKKFDSIMQHQWKNVKNGHASNEGVTMFPSMRISSYNTRYAKVKFRLKTTQLKHYIYSFILFTHLFYLLIYFI